MDNEKSGKLEEWFKEKSTKFSYVPPGNHRVLRAERAIRSAKNHIIATMCTADDNFPAYLWDKLLDQAELTLNHMRVCRSNEKVSAYEGMYGTKYDFMAHPIAPAGIKVVVHDKPDQRPTWAAHGVDGYYLGPALDHYRCWRTWITRTQAVRISDTIAWFPARTRMPGVSALDTLSAAITDVDIALGKVAVTGPAAASRQPYVALQQTAIESLRKIVEMFAPTLTPEEPVELMPQRVEAVDEPALQRVEAVEEPVLQRVEAAERPPPRRAEEEPGGVQRRRLPIPVIPRAPTDRQGKGHNYKYANMARALKRRRYGRMLNALNLTDEGDPLNYRRAKQGPDAHLWAIEEAVEIRRLMATETIQPIHAHEQPMDRRGDTTYYNPQVSEKIKEGKIKIRVRGTIGGDKLKYPGAVAARTADMEVVKILLNSVVSTTDAKWMTADITDFYLGTPLKRKEYLRIPKKLIPDECMEEFGFERYLVNGAALFEVSKGMYGLPQAGLLAKKRLEEHLATEGYFQDEFVPCLFTHVSNGVTFTLVVDDFGIKYTDKVAAQHLLDTLTKLYAITVDWTGSKYLGITLRFDEDQRGRYVALSMPGYVAKQLLRFRPTESKNAASPSIYLPPIMGPQDTFVDNSPHLSDVKIKWVQSVVGAFQFYARAIDPTMLTAVYDIASPGGPPTERLITMCERLMAYAAAYPENELRFYKSDMILEVQADASYLSRSKARSVVGGSLT